MEPEDRWRIRVVDPLHDFLEDCGTCTVEAQEGVAALVHALFKETEPGFGGVTKSFKRILPLFILIILDQLALDVLDTVGCEFQALDRSYLQQTNRVSTRLSLRLEQA